MDDICIVCSRTIDWPEEDVLAAAQQGGAGPSGSGSGSHARRSTNGASSEAGASQSSGMHRTTSSDGKHTTAKGAAAAKAGRPAKHAHTVRIRKNHSTGRLTAKGTHAKHAAGLRPLTSAQSTAPAPTEASSSAPVSEGGETDATNEVTASNLPDWMAIYCSEECRKEDELRSRLSFANLNDERVKCSPSSLPAQQYFGSAASIARNRSSGSLHQPQHASSFAQQHRFPSGLPSSPLANDSEGSEFEWSTGRSSSARNRPTHARQHHQQQVPMQHQHGVSPRRQSSHADRTSLDSRRYSDGSDSSRLSVAADAHRARLSTSRTRDSRGSTDSLASAMSLGDGTSYSYDPSTSSYYQHQHHHHAGSSAGSSGTAYPRPDLTHRSTSALSSGLRAMTPIHASSSSGSLRDRSPPVRPSQAHAPSSSHVAMPGGKDRRPSSANAALTGSGIMIRSNSSISNLSNDDHSNAGYTAASSTFIPSSSRSTFRPASLGKGGLKPSKSSATLALTGISDMRGTIGSEHERYEEQNAAGAASTSYTSPGSRFPGETHRPRKPSHRTHASNSSIPYLSCSPSSPGSGSIASARSAASTAPSSSSARGDPEDGDPHYSHLHAHAARPSRKSAYVDERVRTASLQTYGLFHQRTPSTPSLTALAQQATYGGSSASYGRSPPPQRHMRLSSSYDTTASGGTITRAMRDRHAARTGASGGEGGNGSSRRSTFDINAHGQGHETFLRPHMRHTSSGGATATATAESTPTQSTATTRSPSFADPGPAHEVVHLSTDRGEDGGRPRAPSITRTDLERIPSHTHTQSTASDGSGSAASPPSPDHARYMPQYGYPAKVQRQPSHPAIHQLQSEDYALANARPAHPSQPGRGSYTSAPPPIASRSSFSWDHLPSYVPTYTAMDLDKVRRNKSGASLHSVYEDRDEYDDGSAKLAPQQQQQPLQYSRPLQPAQHKKRLFYFPDDV